MKTDPETPDSETANSARLSRLTRLLKEPLLHFVLAGAAIYLLFGVLGQSESDEALADKNTIVVTEGEINWLAEMWQKKWNRVPSDREMLGLVRDHLREKKMLVPSGRRPQRQFYVTDLPAKFRSVGRHFLGNTIGRARQVDI